MGRTNEEIALGRSYSLHTVRSTRNSAAWALGEATAITSELPFITTANLDLDYAHGSRVWIQGVHTSPSGSDYIHDLL